jgi:glycosyltransferase involved in cell wall biosynthesis
VSLVVTSVGRAEAVARLVGSLERLEGGTPFELILVDQSTDRSATAAVEEVRPSFLWRATTSARGASVGRNTGLNLARGELVGFPDDDCWYEPDTVERVVRHFDTNPGLSGVCGRALTGDGRPCMLRWLPSATDVTPGNYHRTSIAFTMFFRHGALDAAGAWDEGMGPGAPGWYGAGEESDLLLRTLANGARVHYDPTVVVHHDEPRADPGEDFVTKMLHYGAGQGLLWRRYRAAPHVIAYLLARKAGGAVVRRVRGEAVLSRADVAYLRGCLAGLRGVAPPAR